MGNVEKSKENLSKCICMKCPTYNFACKVKSMPGDAMHKVKGDVSKAEHMEALFCAFGKSKCISDDKGCICGDCEVHKENDLSSYDFCLK